MPAAARHLDPIGHSPAMNFLVKGLIAGALAGAALALVIGTGGLAAAALVGGMAAGGAGVGELMSTMSWADKEVCGALTVVAGNVFTNGLAAARAHLDFGECSKHPSPPALVANGSAKVFINGWPAARVDDKTICSAVITSGSANVFIGGGTVQTDIINPEKLVPTWVHVSLFVVGIGAAFVAGPVIAVGGLAVGTLGSLGGFWLGGQVFGEGSDGQKWSLLGGGLLGGLFGAKAAPALWSRLPKPGPLFINARKPVKLDQFNRLNQDDPAVGRTRPGEAGAAAELQGYLKGNLERAAPGESADFVFTSGRHAGKTVDFMLTPDTVMQAAKTNQFFAKNASGFADQLLLHVNKADFVPMDIRFLNNANRAILMEIIQSLPPHLQSKIILLG